MICLAFEAPVWFFVMENFKIFVSVTYNRYFRSNLTQGAANSICEGLELSPTEYISDQMNLVLTCLLFAPIFPPAILLGFAGSIMSYLTRKYYLLNFNKIPRMMSPDLALIFVDMMPYAVLVWVIAFYAFLVNTKQIDHQGEEADKKIITPLAEHMALGAIGVFLLFFFIPITYFLSQNYRDKIQDTGEYFNSKEFKKEDYKEQNPMSGEPGEIGKGL